MGPRAGAAWLEEEFEELARAAPALVAGQRLGVAAALDAEILAMVRAATHLAPPTLRPGAAGSPRVQAGSPRAEAGSPRVLAGELGEDAADLREGLDAALELVEPRPWGTPPAQPGARPVFLPQSQHAVVAAVQPLPANERLASIPADGGAELQLFADHDAPSEHRQYQARGDVSMRVMRMLGAHESVKSEPSELVRKLHDEWTAQPAGQAASKVAAAGGASKDNRAPFVFVPKDPRYTGQRPRRLEKLAAGPSPSRKAVEQQQRAQQAHKALVLCGHVMVGDDKGAGKASAVPLAQVVEPRPQSRQARSPKPKRDPSGESLPKFLVKASSFSALARP